MARRSKARSSRKRKEDLVKSKKPATPSYLLDLPAEIRAKILRHVFKDIRIEILGGFEHPCEADRLQVNWFEQKKLLEPNGADISDDEDDDMASEDSKTSENQDAILRVNKQLCAEARQAMFREVRFALSYTNIFFKTVTIQGTESPSEIEAAVKLMTARRDKDIESGIGKAFERLKAVADKVEIDLDLEKIDIELAFDDYDDNDDDFDNLAMLRDVDSESIQRYLDLCGESHAYYDDDF